MKETKFDHSSDSDTRPCLDYEAALSAVGGDRELLRELAALFLEECPKWMEEMRAAIAQSDAEGVERPAHTLKGTAAQFRAHALSEAASGLEMRARERDLPGSADALPALERALDPVLASLRSFAAGRL